MTRRISAALLITRGEGKDLEVFLAERSTQLRFFGGYWALPGGNIDEIDQREDSETTLQACAQRELFEETGLLWANSTRDPEELTAVRREMLQRDRRGESAPTTHVWAELAGRLPVSPMRELCRIETPPFAPLRYDTTFFHVPLARCSPGTGQTEPEIWSGELTAGHFARPADALASWTRGELRIVPPVVMLLEQLDRAGDFEAFATRIAETTTAYRAGRLHRSRFSPGILAAPLRTPTLPPATTTNCYLVGHDPLYVIDPGSPHPDEQRRLLALLAEREAEGARPRGILVTHQHIDHIGGLHALSTARDLPVHGHALTLARLQPGFVRGRELEDNATLPLGTAPDGSPDWHLRALHTPGHDRGHLCFHESRYETMIVGDMLSTVSTIIVDPPEGHLATYIAGLERLAREPMTTLYPAHGLPVADGHRLVRKYLRHRQHRESALVRTLEEAGTAGATITELLPKVYWDADPRQFSFAGRSLLAGLEKMQEEEKAREEGGRWRLV